MPGRVGRVYVDEGARVRRGQPLLTLETEYLALDLKRADAEVARAKAAAAEAERDFKRKEELIAKDSVARAAYDRSRSAQTRRWPPWRPPRPPATWPASGCGRSAPLADHRRGRRAADRRGRAHGRSSVAFVVVQTSPIKLRFRLPERYLAKVRAGQPVRATVDPYPGRDVLRQGDPDRRRGRSGDPHGRGGDRVRQCRRAAVPGPVRPGRDRPRCRRWTVEGGCR